MYSSFYVGAWYDVFFGKGSFHLKNVWNIVVCASFLAYVVPVNCLDTNFPNSTLFTPTSTVNSLITPGASSSPTANSTFVDPDITLAGSCGYIDASLGVPTTAIWQDTGSYYDGTGYVTESDWNTEVTYAFAQTRLPPPECCATCSIQASRVQVRYFAPETGSVVTTPAPKVPYTLVSDGYTYTSPSVYVVYSGLFAQADCSLYAAGQIGNNISATIVAYAPDALSTAECYQPGDGGFQGWKTINYTEWADLPPNSVVEKQSGCKLLGAELTTIDPAGTDLVASPEFSLPQGLSTLQPAWSKYNCIPWRYGAFDPPRTLTKADAMIPTQAVSATPAAQVSPPLASPTMPGPGDPGLTSTSMSQEPDSFKGDPTVTSPDPDPPLPDPSETTQAAGDPPQSPDPKNQNQRPDPTQAASATAAADPLLTVGSTPYQYHVDPSSNLVVASQTARAGGPAISVAGIQISLASSANDVIVDGTHVPVAAPVSEAITAPQFTVGNQVISANSASQYVVHGQTLSPGAAAISVYGTPISLGPSAVHVVIGTNTILLTSPILQTLPPITVGSQVITADESSNYIVNSQTLVPGAVAITFSGTPISLALSASQLVFGSSTIPLQAGKPSAAPAFTLGNQAVTPDSESNYVIGSQTLMQGGQPISISGTQVSLAPSATQAVVGSSIIPLAGSSPSSPAPIVVNGQTITANSASQYIVGSQTLTPGAPAITVSGTPVSIPANSQSIMTIGSQLYPIAMDINGNIVVLSQTIIPGGSPIVVGGETISEVQASSEVVVASGGSTTTEGLGEIIAGALGKTAAATGSGGPNASATGLTFTGGVSRLWGKQDFSFTMIAAAVAAGFIMYR